DLIEKFQVKGLTITFSSFATKITNFRVEPFLHFFPNRWTPSREFLHVISGFQRLELELINFPAEYICPLIEVGLETVNSF
ncbi:hypothetical protein PMAYCL1PPCAC_28335, partial [Pristionchus mayeri]